MQPRALAVVIGALLLAAGRADAAGGRGATVERFAIVIGNNRPETAATPTLRYADDDALATHRLLGQAGVDSVLLARLDDATARLHPDVAPDGRPTWRDLEARLRDLAARMRAAAAAGADTELMVFYSGHGDVANGEGYVVLEDARLTRTRLYDEVLARSPATRNHVIVDACKSYFLAFERGPGGERAAYRGSFARSTMTTRVHNTGFVLSTSSDRDSHEWERYQAGVFSHEVRSGLRGGADADADGRITYAELGAFLTTANASIANARYRPDFAVRPPGGSADALARSVLAWPAGVDAVTVGGGAGLGHVYVETARGERLADVHVTDGAAAAVRVPAERPLFVRAHDERRERVVAASGPATVVSFGDEPVEIARKGALHLAFEALFSTPFGPAQVSAFEQRYLEALRADLVALDEARGSPRRARVRRVASWTAVGAVALGVGANLWAAERRGAGEGASQAERDELNGTIDTLNTTSVVCYAVAGAAGATWLAMTLFPGKAQPDRRVIVRPTPAGTGGAGAGVALEISW
jgi:hypothetical protein